METYATRDDLITRFSETEIAALEDPENTGISNADISASALSDATDFINSYLATRYPIPLPSIPTLLVGTTCDIARYNLYTEKPLDVIQKRYDNAVKWLIDVSRGLVQLTFDKPLPVDKDGVLPKVATTSTVGAFNDGKLGKMPTDDRAWGWGRIR